MARSSGSSAPSEASEALADIDHQRGKYTEGLDLLRQAIEITPDLHTKPEDSRAAMTDPTDSAAFQVEFSGYQPARGERVVITAELESAIARKYLEFDRDRRLAAAHPACDCRRRHVRGEDDGRIHVSLRSSRRNMRLAYAMVKFSVNNGKSLPVTVPTVARVH